MYRTKHPCPTFNEVIKKNRNIIESCIYMYLCMELNKLNNNHLMYSPSLVPQIAISFRLSSRSKTFIDNTFTAGHYQRNILSGNILSRIFGHLAQFILFPIAHVTKMSIYKRILRISNQMFVKEI